MTTAELTQDERDFCARGLYPIAGIPDHCAGPEARLNEQNARIRALVKFQRKHKLTNKATAAALGVSPSKLSRWLSADAQIPAEVAFAAAKATV
jgi:hypothetical protein